MFECELRDPTDNHVLVKFEVELCKVWLLKMHGLRMSRSGGSVFLYKEFYSTFAKKLGWK